MSATTESIKPPKKTLTVWTTAIPLYFELIAINFIGLMDVFFMSLVSDQAVAALGACTQVILVFTLLIRTLTGGAGSIAAQNIGAKNRVNALLAFMYAMAIAAVFGGAFALTLLAGHKHIGLWMGLSGEALVITQIYLSIIGPAFFLLALRTGYTTILAVKGKSNINLVCALISNLANIFFNCLFVLGWLGAPQLGVAGVAIATALSHLIYLTLIAYIAHRFLGVRFVFPKNIIQRLHALTRPVMKIAIPNCGDLLSYSLFLVVIVSIVIRIDEKAAAAYTYVHQAMAFIIIWSFSVAQGQAIWTAHLVGAKQFSNASREVKRTILRCLAVALPCTLLLLGFSKHVFALFTSDAEILKLTTTAVVAYLGIEVGRAFNVTLSLSLAAAGDARYPAVLGLIFNWLIGVPLALALGIGLEWGLLGALLGIAIDELLRAPLNYLRFSKGHWKHTSNPIP